MPGSSGNGKAGTLRERFAHNQAEREQAIARLEGVEWDDHDEITAEHLLDAVKAGAALAVEATGSHKAVAAEAPSSAPRVAKGFAVVLREANTWPKVAALALLVLLVALAWRLGISLKP